MTYLLKNGAGIEDAEHGRRSCSCAPLVNASCRFGR
jgi:hypothetical protein